MTKPGSKIAAPAKGLKTSRRGAMKLMAGAALLAGTSRLSRAQDSTRTLRVGLNKAMVFTPALLLEENMPGWKVELFYFNAPSDMATGLGANSIDLAYTGLTIAAIARSRGQPLSVIANAAERGSAILVRTSSDAETITDLVGRKVGTQPGGIQDVLLREEFRKAGIPTSDVDLVRLTYADMPLALQRGDIEAYCGGEPNATQVVRDGYGRVLMFPYDNPVGTINGCLLAREETSEAGIEMLAMATQAHARATEMLEAQPDTWAELTSREWGYDEAVTREAISNVSLRWRMDDNFMQSYATYMERLHEFGLIDQIPDVASIVTRRYVDGVQL